ncbi:MAG TPA: GNAT family N-acetyltransferase [Burkholderiales bacterium]|nr:GNAT family N-acetyltransferase [Burkholderiales bacterium]
MSMNIVDVTDADGEVLHVALLARAEPVHRQLRPDLPPDYVTKMRRVFAGGGRMSVVLVDAEVRGVAVYRAFENTSDDAKFYIDDIVVDTVARSQGVGSALMAHLQKKARLLNCKTFALDSGTQRHDAHRFYFREGMSIMSFAFKKQL